MRCNKVVQVAVVIIFLVRTTQNKNKLPTYVAYIAWCSSCRTPDDKVGVTGKEQKDT